MRRTGYFLALSLGSLVLGRTLEQPEPVPQPEPVVERVSFEPRMAVAVPAALKREGNLEFGYVTLDAATN